MFKEHIGLAGLIQAFVLYSMNSVCFTILGHPVYWYGVLVALGFVAGVTHWIILGRREGRPSSFGSDLGFWVMLSGILGARIGYVISELPEFMERPATIFRIDQGGLIFYGGLISATLAVLIFARIKHEKLWPFMDFAVTALPLGHAFGRIGCFINGCCYGTSSSLPWSVVVDGLARHPTQLYEAACNFTIYLVLLWVYCRRRHDGRILALYFMLYGLVRFVFEFYRGDPRMRWLGFTVAQEISLLLMVVGLGLWLFLPRHDSRPSSAGTIHERKNH